MQGKDPGMRNAEKKDEQACCCTRADKVLEALGGKEINR